MPPGRVKKGKKKRKGGGEGKEGGGKGADRRGYRACHIKKKRKGGKGRLFGDRDVIRAILEVGAEGEGKERKRKREGRKKVGKTLLMPCNVTLAQGEKGGKGEKRKKKRRGTAPPRPNVASAWTVHREKEKRRLSRFLNSATPGEGGKKGKKKKKERGEGESLRISIP